MHISYINILVFNLLSPLRVSNLRVHLQEDGCVYSFGTVRFTCVCISNLAGSRACWVLLLLVNSFA
jgi:hypothetical protein